LVTESISAIGRKMGAKTTSTKRRTATKIVPRCLRLKRQCHPNCCHGRWHWNFHVHRRRSCAVRVAERDCGLAEKTGRVLQEERQVRVAA
jgi:hypothetical protein